LRGSENLIAHLPYSPEKRPRGAACVSYQLHVCRFAEYTHLNLVDYILSLAHLLLYPPECEKLLVSALLHDSATIENTDYIGVPNSRQPMGYGDGNSVI